MNIKETIVKGYFTVKNKTIKHSPELLLAAGIVGGISATVMACKATTKLNDILEQTKDDVELIHDSVGREDLAEEYTEEDSKKDLALVYFQTGVKVAKVYAPSVILGAVSIASILVSNDIMRKRNLALAAAYATIDTGFKSYRSRVAERFGEEVEKEIRHNIKARAVEVISNDKDGNEVVTVEESKTFGHSSEYSEYARFFDDGCIGWTKDSEHNLMYLRIQERVLNDKLRVEGMVFLNDVYDVLGIPRTKAGQIVGWIYNPARTDIDSYIDFGIYEGNRPRNVDFVNGYERTILLDFNVDGNIWDTMKR